ncbi:MAG: NADPH-dependent assimilatory sulfite reductase hemoprotein subunit [Wenzhouxiangella sp.]
MAAHLDVEQIKRDSDHLRGTLAISLKDPLTAAVAEPDTVITKFHGIYQQDDRDQREARREARLEPAYSFMIRVRVPGGVITPDQWLALDGLADEVANGTIRLTTRQAVQFHGVAKEQLPLLIQRIDAVLMDSLAACGDVNRNVMCHVQPEAGPVHAQALDWARKLSAHLTPATGAYREIWIDGNLAAGNENEVEPIYGKTYLPRKFKAAIAMPPSNDVDIFSQDLGLIVIAEGDDLVGFNLSVGGGLGCSHGEAQTFPRLADVIGFIQPEQVLTVAESIVTIQRDFGDRSNRKHARFKYTVDDRGTDWLADELERRTGIELAPARPFTFASNNDHYGWRQMRDGRWQLTLFVENGRLLPRPRAGLRSLLQSLVSDIRLTPNQNLIIAGIEDENRAAVDQLVTEYGLEGEQAPSMIRRNSMACVALPTCGLAMAEAERYLPDLVTRIEELAARHGIEEQPITMRMSGCPNGCSRPYLAEIGLVGRAPGRYNLYLGAAADGSRLNRLDLDNADESRILSRIDDLFARYSSEREPAEHFGEFLVRADVIRAVIHGSEVNVA